MIRRAGSCEAIVANRDAFANADAPNAWRE
jgi:hypothetical protein